MTRSKEPRTGGRCHGGIGNVQRLPPHRGSQVVVTPHTWGLRPRLLPVAASRLDAVTALRLKFGNQLIHRGKEVRLVSDSLPSEPDVRFSRIRLSG